MKNHDQQKYRNLVKQTILEKLQAFGLTKGEAKVYMNLNKNGPKKATEITREEKIPRTRTYRILSNLQAKGAIETLNDKPMKYCALPIDKVLDSLINYESIKIQKMKKMKEDLQYMWNMAQGLRHQKTSDFTKYEEAMKKYSDIHKFKEDFKRSLKQYRQKSPVPKK